MGPALRKGSNICEPERGAVMAGNKMSEIQRRKGGKEEKWEMQIVGGRRDFMHGKHGGHFAHDHRTGF